MMSVLSLTAWESGNDRKNILTEKRLGKQTDDRT